MASLARDIRRFSRRFKEALELDWADEVAQQQIDVWRDAISRRQATTFTRLISEGLTVEEATAEIAQSARGLTDAQLETVFRTLAAGAQHAAQWQADQLDDFWGYRYLTMADDRVRDTHRPLHGITLPRDHIWWQTYWPPNGWNCRCQVIQWNNPRNETRTRHLNVPPPDEGFAGNFGQFFRF